MLKIGSLCSGYGGLDLAVEKFFNAETVWMADLDKSAALAIEQNWALPNLGDLTQVDWLEVEPIDILTAGYPCQPFSHAGQRKGTQDARHIWPSIKEVIGTLRPKWVILENVRGHLSLGFKEVLKDLAELGYDARWSIIRASDVGAPHQRARLFIIAYPNSKTLQQSRRALRPVRKPTSEVINGSDREINRSSVKNYSNSDCEYGGISLSNKIDSNANNQQLSSDRQMPQLGRGFDSRLEMSMRSIPDPLVDGKLNTKFVEYMMGLPEGWVTNLPLSRAQQFKLLGNGVVPQQAYKALEILCDSGHTERDTPRK